MLYILVTDIQPEIKYSCELTIRLMDTGVALRFNTEEFIVPSSFLYYDKVKFILLYICLQYNIEWHSNPPN